MSTDPSSDKQTNPWLVLIVLCLGFFMIMLDTTIVNIALPQMGSGLHASLDQVVWVVNAYLLSYTILLIPSGRLGDIWGPRNLFIVGLVVFTLASVACGVSQGSGELITARVIQGAGAALLTPQTLTIIAVVFPPARRGSAMGVWGSVVGLSTVAGPTLGGLLVEYASWRWIFFVNVPLGILALAGALRYLPDPRPGRKHRFDLVGVLLAAAGLFCVVYGLLEGERYSWGKFWGPITIVELLVVGALLLVGLVLWERVPEEPLVPLRLFRTHNYSLMIWIQLLLAFGMLAIYIPLVLALQSGLGMSALRAGLTLAPMSIAASAVAPVSGKLADKYGGKYLLGAGLALFAGGIALMWPAISLDASWVSFLGPGVVAGIGLGLANAPLTSEAMRSVQPQDAGAASGLLNSTRQLGGLVGTTVVSVVLQNRFQTALDHRARDTASGLNVSPDVREKFVHAFSDVGSTGLQVTPGQSGGVHLPTGLPASTTHTLQAAGHQVFIHGLVDAAGPALGVPMAVVAVGALSSLFAVNRRRVAAKPPVPAAPQPSDATASSS